MTDSTHAGPSGAAPALATPALGGLAILAADDAFGAMLVDRASVIGAECVELVVPGPGPEDAARALDRLARRRDVTAIAVAAPSLGRPAAFADIARAIAPHVPLCVLDWPAGVEVDPWRAPWLASLGAVVCRRVDELLCAAVALARVDPPAGPRVAVCGRSALAPWLATAIARTVGVDAVFEAADPRTIMASTRFDLVVACIDGATELPALAAARATHEDVGLIAIADGGYHRIDVARAALAVVGVPVFATPDQLVDGLIGLATWVDSRGRLRPAATPRVADAHRLRRAVASVRDGRARGDDADVRTELIAALGQHAAPWRRAHYVEDALIAAGDLGYPVAVVAEGDAVSPVLIARDSNELAAAAERALAAARARLDHPRTAIVRRYVDGASRVRVSVGRHEDYGPVLAISDGRRTVRAVGWLDDVTAASCARRLAGEERAALAAAALTSATTAALAALHTVDELESVELGPVALTSTGAIVEDADFVVRLRADS